MHTTIMVQRSAVANAKMKLTLLSKQKLYFILKTSQLDAVRFFLALSFFDTLYLPNKF
jgi:hypothetical protein